MKNLTNNEESSNDEEPNLDKIEDYKNSEQFPLDDRKGREGGRRNGI